MAQSEWVKRKKSTQQRWQAKIPQVRNLEKRREEQQHQKITLPLFERKTIQEAKLWWRRFIQYVKMTQKINLNRMTTDKEIIEEYREEFEIKIKDLFIWALGEEAVTEMTKTVRDNDPNKMNINQLYSLFRLHIIPERNKFQSRADFFGIVSEPNETVEDVWTTRILQTEKKCEIDNVTPAELIASKFLSLIGRSTGDYELKKKIRKSNMTIETITDLIHEYMYDRLNDSNNSNDGRNVEHVQERPQRRKWSEKSSYERIKKRPEYQKQRYKDNRWGQCGTPNLSRQHICPARIAECRNCKKKGHYEKCADSRRNSNMWIKLHLPLRKTTGIITKYKQYQQQQEKRSFLSRNTIGQWRTNKIHNRQRITSYTNTPKTIQWHFRGDEAKHELQRCKWQQNWIPGANNSNGGNKQDDDTTTIANCQSKYNTVNGITLDEPAWHSTQHNIGGY